MLRRVTETLNGRTVLVVEDEPLVALDIAELLTASGATVSSTSSLRGALALAERLVFSAAVLDVRLGGEDCSAVCQRLSERGTPFLFYTGYTSGIVLSSWPNSPVLGKPVIGERIIEAVLKLCNPPS